MDFSDVESPIVETQNSLVVNLKNQHYQCENMNISQRLFRDDGTPYQTPEECADAVVSKGIQSRLIAFPDPDEPASSIYWGCFTCLDETETSTSGFNWNTYSIEIPEPGCHVVRRQSNTSHVYYSYLAHPAPTRAPTLAPTLAPTVYPTVAPTLAPTPIPTHAPTLAPTIDPTLAPTLHPTYAPTIAPTTVFSEVEAEIKSIEPQIVTSVYVIFSLIFVFMIVVVSLLRVLFFLV